MAEIEQVAKVIEKIRKDKIVPETAEAIGQVIADTKPPKPAASEREDVKSMKSSQSSKSADTTMRVSGKSNTPEDRRALEIEGRWRRAKVPQRHREQAQNGYDPDHEAWNESLQDIKNLLGGGTLVVITGSRGRGKTQLAVEAIRIATADGWSARYTKVMDIFLAIRASFDQPGETEMSAIAQFLSPHLLVIDELEERKETSFEDRLLSHIIDKRYDMLRDTILISHLPSSEIAKSVGLSIAGRLLETGCVIDCDWESFRVGKKETTDGK